MLFLGAQIMRKIAFAYKDQLSKSKPSPARALFRGSGFGVFLASIPLAQLLYQDASRHVGQADMREHKGRIDCVLLIAKMRAETLL